MNQISRLPPSSVCYYFSFRHSDKSFICSRCLGPHKFWAINHLYHYYYSTYESALLKHFVKSRKNTDLFEKKLKETELLKVTKKQATEKTMTVGKLNASLITAFAQEPGMILNDTKDSRYKRGIKKKVGLSGEHKKEQGHSDVAGSNSSNNLNKSAMGTSKRFSEVIEDPKNFNKSTNNDYYSHRYSNFFESTKANVNCLPSVPSYSSHTPDKRFYPSQEHEGYDICTSEELQIEESFSEGTKDASVSSPPSDLHDIFQVKSSVFDEVDKSDQLLLGLVDVCVNNEMLENAFELLCRQRGDTRKSLIYDIVLKGYSEKGNWSGVEKIFSLLAQHKVPPSRTTFALSLACLYGLSESTNYKVQKAKALLTNFQLMGYRISELFENKRLNCLERENVLQVVRWFFPNFKLTPPEFSFPTRFQIVSDLYDEDFVVSSPLPYFKPSEMAKAVEEQLILETKLFCEVESVVKRGTCCPKSKKDWKFLVENWKKNLHINFRRRHNALKEELQEKIHVPNIYPFLNCLSEEDFVNLMIFEIYRLCLSSEGFTVCTSFLYKLIGRRVWHRYCIKKKINNNELMGKYKDFINTYSSWYLNPSKTAEGFRQKWSKMMWHNPNIMSMGDGNIRWPDAVQVKIGKFLFDIILKSTIIPSSLLDSKGEKKAVPAFYLVLRCSKGKLSEQLKFHPFVGSLYRRANLNTLFFEVDQLPMICPPKPWTSVDSGGFYILPTNCLRPTQFNYNQRMLRSVRSSNLYVIFDSLNQLQSVPWAVNENVLDVVLQVFREGGSRELNVPVYPDMSPLPEPNEVIDSTMKAAAYKERLKIMQQRQEDFALWCEGLYKLSLANHFRKKVFWLPHNMDFRGRVYPVSPHISHITSDLYRSLFLFAKKEPLGENGLDWLKIHAINLTGTFSKRPVAERLMHANDVLDDILDSAERPLHGRRWWTKSDEPWQTLATCFEIWNALHCGDPRIYETGFPVHQDGSCNGLQHYAALGRDSIGAASVNLNPADKPQDVYTVVANLIEEIRKKDAQEGVEIASVLEGFVTRKVVKQTVMTTVYGVTLYGARLQIMGRLAEQPSFPSDRIKEAGIYLSTKVFEALKEMFTSAKEIQDWFLTCASVITGPCESTVSWVTPLGLPVIQPYFKCSENSRETLSNLLPDKRKQKNAFPPNFIHSLDSSHMMLTALYCGKAGLCFASVHDCFWTHPAHVDIMNRICREQFIALHSQEILSDLAGHFVKTYGSANLPTIHAHFMNIPKTGNFELKNVLDSVYFFS